MTFQKVGAEKATNVDALAIAPGEEALTFARTEEGGRRRLLLVYAYAGGILTGVDLSEVLGHEIDDPIDVYATHGYDGVRMLGARGPMVTVSSSSLTAPVALNGSHIAVGTNFPEHANEATVREGPFLFPKEVVPTPYDAPISIGDGLIDYEVELCFVALEDMDLDRVPERAGLLLCNDVTDRAKLLRNVDPGNVVSGKGFTTGKSAPGFMPVGTLFVIPRDLRAFAARIELRLYRNGELKQSARQSEAIWDFDELLRQTKLRKSQTWEYQGKKVGLAIRENRIPARTAILAGTPSGTIFRGLHKRAILRGVADWVCGGWKMPLPHWIVERQISYDRKSRSYLQPGEKISIQVDYMGELHNELVE